jgi:hypothetical protein
MEPLVKKFALAILIAALKLPLASAGWAAAAVFILMFDRNTQLKIMLVSLLFSTVVTCVSLYAKPQQNAYAVAKATRVVQTAAN